MRSVEELLSRFGSRLYVYRLRQGDSAVADLSAAFARAIRSVLFGDGQSPSGQHPPTRRGRVPDRDQLARRASRDCSGGVAPVDCLYTGPAKTLEEITHALFTDVRRFFCESLTDLRRADAALARRRQSACLLRVNSRPAGAAMTGDTWGGVSAAGMRMTGLPSQFGIGIGIRENRRPPARSAVCTQDGATRPVEVVYDGDRVVSVSSRADAHDVGQSRVASASAGTVTLLDRTVRSA